MIFFTTTILYTILQVHVSKKKSYNITLMTSYFGSVTFYLLMTAKENPTKRPITGCKKSSLLNPNLECLKKLWESGSWTLRVTSQSHNSTLLRHPLPPPNSLWHRDNLDFTPFNSRTHLKPDIFHLYLQAHRSVQVLFLWTFRLQFAPKQLWMS